VIVAVHVHGNATVGVIERFTNLVAHGVPMGRDPDGNSVVHSAIATSRSRPRWCSGARARHTITGAATPTMAATITFTGFERAL